MNPINSLTKQFKPNLHWHKSHLDALSILIVAIIKRRTVNWAELATTFPGVAATPSCYRRIQRFFKDVAFKEETIAQLIAHLFAPEGAWMLSMDRTNWMFGKFKINILYLAINYKGMAIPILWTLLPKKGCSNTQERIDLLERFQKIFPEQPVRRLLADREFRGIRWLKYLRSHHWPFCIRIPVNTLVPNKHQNRELPIRRLFSLGIGETMAMEKPRKVWGQVHRRSRKSSHEPRSSSLKKKSTPAGSGSTIRTIGTASETSKSTLRKSSGSCLICTTTLPGSVPTNGRT